MYRHLFNPVNLTRHFYTDFIKVIKSEYLATIWSVVLGEGPKAARNKETCARLTGNWAMGLSFKRQLLITLQDSGCRQVKSCLFLLKTLTRGKFILRIIAGSSQTSNQYNVSVVQAALGKCTRRHRRRTSADFIFIEDGLVSRAETKGKTHWASCNTAADIRKSHRAHKPVDDSL